MNPNKKSIKTICLSLIGNIAMVLVKGFAGVVGNSHALIADAIESTSDVLSSVLVLVGLKYAHKPADKNHPYGHGKIEPLIAFMIVAFLLISATIIAYNSIKNIGLPQEPPKAWTLIVLSVIIIIKELLYRFVSKAGNSTQSSSLKADAWHHRSDVITSATAFIGISVALIFGEGYEVADDWAALIASIIIVYNSFLIFRPALSEIMDENQYDELINCIKEKSLEVEGILDTEKCFVRKYGNQFYVDLHAIVDADMSVKQGHLLAHKLKDYLQLNIQSIYYVLVHIEPFDENVSSKNQVTNL